ncbi:hypothetical protein BDP27DRAFT_1405645 [Rhodocollybia butyracea]|uniref:F-box domain-containing protein n=1 Tax=Rhodocollybia butyracea TaxID=206335 RepID=A0A9P5PH16_9AGAR|nr:hypothetical protein BDP27DRAFT_1429258 [Rhodocollybia butyracea]KAF9063743.1 hypothetical protein BDP27DRAFT_1405645 [Rhodocollybia butyracea]
MSMLVELPDDVLFNVIKFLAAPDIFTTRKTCKRFQAITMVRNVWTTAYKTSSGGFFPIVDLASQTTVDLEQLVLRAHQMDMFWANPSHARRFYEQRWQLDSETCGIDISDIVDEGLYLGRYLILHHPQVILVYDLQIKNEVFRYNAPVNHEFLFLHNSCHTTIRDRETDYFLPFVVSRETRSVLMVQISPLGTMTITDCPELQFLVEHGVYAYLCMSNDLAVIQPEHEERAVQVIHLPSRKIYPFSLKPTDAPPDISFSSALFIPGGYVLLSFRTSGSSVNHFFALYRLHDHINQSAGTPLYPTHQGHFEVDFMRLHLLCSETSTTGSLWFMACLRARYNMFYLVHITLHGDGRLAFDMGDNVPNVLWGLHLTVNSSGRARGFAQGKVNTHGPWMLCDVHVNSKGEPLIHISTLNILGNDNFIGDLDVFRGVLVSYGRNKIDIRRLVV